MEPNTAAQRLAGANRPANYVPLPASKLQSIGRETEYGCVDWYPYASAMPSRTEWFDYDNGLAVAGSTLTHP
jgi:hypothetical protein